MGTVVGLFDSRLQAENAIDRLQRGGFDAQDISFVMRDRDEAGDMQDSTGVKGATAKGAISGGVLGGVAGLLVGISALAIPGIGPVLAAGPILTTVAGTALGAAAGGLIGALVDAGVPEDEARYYNEGVERGGILVTVRVPDGKEPIARTILQEAGMRDVRQDAQNWQNDKEWRYGRHQAADEEADRSGLKESFTQTAAAIGSLGSFMGAGMTSTGNTGTGTGNFASPIAARASGATDPDRGITDENTEMNDTTAGAGSPYMGGASGTATGMADARSSDDTTRSGRRLFAGPEFDEPDQVDNTREGLALGAAGTVTGTTFGSPYAAAVGGAMSERAGEEAGTPSRNVETNQGSVDTHTTGGGASHNPDRERA